MIERKRFSHGFYIHSSGNTKSWQSGGGEKTISDQPTLKDSGAGKQISVELKWDTVSDPVAENKGAATVNDIVPVPVCNFGTERASGFKQDATKNDLVQCSPPDETEDYETRRSFWFALASYIIIAACLFIWMFSMPVFWICLLLAMACSITALVYARRSKRKHEPGEKYPGKWKIIAAKLVFVLNILFAFLAILVAIGTR